MKKNKNARTAIKNSKSQPTKKAAGSSAASPANISASSVEGKRKRGRPRKNPLQQPGIVPLDPPRLKPGKALVFRHAPENWDEKEWQSATREAIGGELPPLIREETVSSTAPSKNSLAGEADWASLGPPAPPAPASAPSTGSQADIAKGFEAVAASIPPDAGSVPPAATAAAPEEEIKHALRLEVVRTNLHNWLRAGIDIPFNFVARRQGEHWQLTEQEREDIIAVLIPVIEINLPRLMVLLQKVGQPEYVFAATVISCILIKKWTHVPTEAERAKETPAPPQAHRIMAGVRGNGQGTPAFSGSPAPANRGFSSGLSSPATAS